MNAKLYKVKEHFVLEINKNNVPQIAKVVGQAGRNPDEVIIASTEENTSYLKLSLENCQAIEFGYDLKELVREDFFDNKYQYHLANNHLAFFKAGFQKCLEILGDKKFGIEQVVELTKILISNPIEKSGKQPQELVDSYIKSLQQTEWEVEIEVENHLLLSNPPKQIPKLDYNGCIILKQKK